MTLSDQIYTYATPYGTVNVIGGIRYTRYNGRLCYSVVTTGDHDAFFAPQDHELYPEILYWEDREDGTRQTWYVPKGEWFLPHAEAMEKWKQW
jgi:hypothetical protein